MKIFLVSEEYPPATNWGGIATYTHSLAVALESRGEDVTVFTRSETDGEVIVNDCGVRVVKLRCPPVEESISAGIAVPWLSRFKLPVDGFTRDRLSFIAALRKKALTLCDEEGRPDMIEVPDWGATGLAFVGGKAMPIKYLVHLHTPTLLVDESNNIAPSKRLKPVSAMEILAIRRAQMVVSPSRYLATEVTGRFGLDFKRVNVIPHPLDGDFWNETARDFTAEIPKKPYLFYAGRLEHRKGVLLLLEAFASLKRTHPGLSLVMAGSDTPTGPGETSYETELVKRAAALGITDSILRLPSQERLNLRALLQNADIFVVPSLYENAPYVVLEAQAAGRPIVAFDVGGIGEYITHDEDGLLVPRENAAALHLTLKRLLADDEMKERLGRRAAARALGTLEPKYIARLTTELYEQVIYQ